MGVEQFSPVAFTGTAVERLPPNLRHPAKHKKKKTGPTPNPTATGTGAPNPYPYPTYSCDPKVVTCTPDATRTPARPTPLRPARTVTP